MPALAKVLVFPNGLEERAPELVAPLFRLTPPEPPMPKKPRRRRKPPVSLSEAQLLALLQKAKEHRQRDYVMILTTYWHGLRASETVSLRETDFDLKEDTVEVRRGKGSEGGRHNLMAWPDNPLLDERTVVREWLTNRGLFGVKGGAKRQTGQIRKLPSVAYKSHPGAEDVGKAGQPRSATDGLLPGSASLPLAPERRTDPSQIINDPAKMQQSTQIVAFSPVETKTSHFPTGFEGHGKAAFAMRIPDPPADRETLGSDRSAQDSRPGERRFAELCKPAGGYESLPEAPRELLGPFPPRSTPSELLFPITRGQFWRIVHNYALAAGIPRRKCKTHMLKHTIAKHLVRAGHPLNEIQEWMGWSSLETMNWYTRADEEELGNRIGDSIRGKVGLRQVVQGSLFPG